MAAQGYSHRAPPDKDLIQALMVPTFEIKAEVSSVCELQYADLDCVKPAGGDCPGT